ncbi:unnamed protein product [Schistocephalus solidus]|uniref:Reverse transcriptase domain-containing protein n=1 Tax=Schistocephalus solidus TaxID=70667 RepID=A0A183T5S6_SCHSO|nr:unnamed protein product [Schistocephalus solidus]
MVHAVYINFQRAFKIVPHQRPLHKLRSVGVRGSLLVLIHNFWIGRSQRVQVGRQQSSEVTMVSDVPQGSVLGPILFLVFINDCVRDLECDALLFADDLKLWKVVDDTADDHLQLNLNRLEDSSKRWLMSFNHITVESLEGCKTFQAEFEAPLTEYYSVAAANQSEQWTHLGIITQKIRMIATAESFDQLRQNIVRAEKGTRKTQVLIDLKASEMTVLRSNALPNPFPPACFLVYRLNTLDCIARLFYVRPSAAR